MMDSTQKEQVLEALRLGLTLGRAAAIAGRRAEEVRDSMRDDPAFAARIKQAPAQIEAELLAKLHSATQWQAAKFVLEAVFPARYSNKRRKPGARPKRRPASPTAAQRLARLTESERSAFFLLMGKMNESADAVAEALPDVAPPCGDSTQSQAMTTT